MHTRREPPLELLPPWWRQACAAAVGVLLVLLGGQALAIPDSLFDAHLEGPIGHYVRDAGGMQLGLGAAAAWGAFRPRFLPGAMAATGAASGVALLPHALSPSLTWDMPALLLAVTLSVAAASRPGAVATPG